MSSRLRKGNSAKISFFAFQDIITSVTGILILVVLLLTFTLKQDAPVSQTSQNIQIEIERIQRQIQEVESQNREMQNIQSSLEDPQFQTRLRDSIPALRSQIAEISPRLEQVRQTLKQSSAAQQAMAPQLQKISAEEAEVKQLETRRQELEKKLAETREAANTVFLIPEQDPAAGQKKPVLMVFSDVKGAIERYKEPSSKLEVPLLNPSEAFEQILARFDRDADYLVLYFRPSSIKHFKTFREQARLAGFEVGYDAVEEDKEIVFSGFKPR